MTDAILIATDGTTKRVKLPPALDVAELEALREMVGGSFELVTITPELAGYINGTGKIDGLEENSLATHLCQQHNRLIPGDWIAGYFCTKVRKLSLDIA